MLKFLIILPFVVGPLSIIQSQTVQKSPKAIDARIYEVYEKSYVDELALNDAFWVHRWTFYLDNAFFVTDEILSKDGNEETYPSVKIKDLAQINILQLENEQHLKHDFYTSTIYKIEGSNKCLVYLPGRDFVEKLNEYLKQYKVKSIEYKVMSK